MDYFIKVRQISLRAASVAFILAVLAAISGRWPVAFGVLIGFLVALIKFRLLAQSIPRLSELPFQAARKGAAVRYILRYALTISVLLMVNANPNLNVWAAFVGLVLIKAVILGEAVFIFARQKLQSGLNPARWERGDE
ncbi:MAG: ATP synthase subunit I [Eubacteriales bacterium]|nr:ATP synthase subunit I [Eubacteriales bacterium]